ncbi:DUF6404 family protein [Pseudoduganella sp. OTU4001]|uniref:DUF6404 family protein n=1 Tax=Pseudoduganella sp. OTU4001 TaxID=3043854 RepID=UPI00406C2AE7
MTHSEKLIRMREHLVTLGISPSTSAPPAWKILWCLGIEMPPPLFMGFWPLALFMGTFFGAFWGIFMWLLQWSSEGTPPLAILGASILAGVLFGLCMAMYCRSLARKHNLTAWHAYTGEQS